MYELFDPQTMLEILSGGLFGVLRKLGILSGFVMGFAQGKACAEMSCSRNGQLQHFHRISKFVDVAVMHQLLFNIILS